jgi:hypothetical protein
MGEEKQQTGLEDILGGLAGNLNLNIPLWGKILVFGAKFLPIPAWLKAMLPIVIGVIESLPHGQKESAKTELVAAAKEARRTGSAAPLVPVMKRYASGVGSAPDLK